MVEAIKFADIGSSILVGTSRGEKYDFTTSATKALVTATPAYALDTADKEVQNAISNLGMETEMIQESLAQLALGTRDDYKKYLGYKSGLLTQIRATVLRSYIETYQRYKAIGLSDREASKLGQEAAISTKAIQMGIYSKIFVNKGEEAKRVF